MLRTLAGLVTIAFSAGFASGQTSAPPTSDRVFHFTHTEGANNFQQVATLLRTITDMKQASVDEAQKTVTVNGTGAQLDLAEWLFTEMDNAQVPAPNNANSASLAYRMQDKQGEDAIRVFYLSNTATVPMFQEAATAIRTVADLRRAFTYNSTRAMVIRGTGEQIALAAWLVGQLGLSVPQASAAPEYHLPGNGTGLSGADPETVVRVLRASQAGTVQDFQELATAIRTITDMRRVFTYNSSRAMLVRGTGEQIGLAVWTLQQLDKPAIGQSVPQSFPSSAIYEFVTPYDRDNIVRVFYLPQTATVQDFQKVAKSIRETSNLRRVFTCNAPRALAVRGTIDQVAVAERMIRDLVTPPQP